MGKKKAKAGAFVLDCSIAVAWFFQDEADPYADAIASRFPNAEAVVPSIWPLEVANALLMGERRKRSTPADTVQWLSSLNSLPITIEDQPANRAWSDVLNLARAHNLSAYDASYLELALRCALPLATLDDKLKVASAAVGVPAYKP